MLRVPLVVSIVLFVLCLFGGQISRPRLVGGWFAAGVILQLLGGLYSPLWLIGLLISVAVSIYLAWLLGIR